MRLLLDECLPRKLARAFPGHEVLTVQALNWSGKKNGELLAAMNAEKLDVLLTVDQNLRYQQHLPQYSVSLIVLRTSSNRLLDLLPFVPQIEAALLSIKAGEIIELTNFS